MTKIHELKLLNDFCDDVLNGRKNFEVRENDRGFQTGDHVRFKRVDSNRIEWPGHEVEKKEYVITYILSGWGIGENKVVFGIKPFEEVTKCEDLEPRKTILDIIEIDQYSCVNNILCPWCKEEIGRSEKAKFCPLCGKPIINIEFEEIDAKLNEYFERKRKEAEDANNRQNE